MEDTEIVLIKTNADIKIRENQPFIYENIKYICKRIITLTFEESARFRIQLEVSAIRLEGEVCPHCPMPIYGSQQALRHNGQVMHLKCAIESGDFERIRKEASPQ